MDIRSLLVNAAIGIITSSVTAYITTVIKVKQEKEKWSRDFALKYAEMQANDISGAQRMAEQFAIGVLIYDSPNIGERERFFVPQNCRLTVGADEANSIVIDHETVARQHCAFDSDDKNTYVLDLGSPNGVYVKSSGESRYGARVDGKQRLFSDDVISVGKIPLRYYQLDGARKL